MKEIYAYEIKYEQTLPNKRKIELIYPDNAMHFIISGYGYFNGKKLGAGSGFICKSGNYVSYYPDEAEPWLYCWIGINGADSQIYIDKYKKSDYVFSFENTVEFFEIFKMLSKRSPDYLLSSEYQASCFNIISSFNTDYKITKSTEISIIEKAKIYINNNYYSQISVNNIADNLHISRGYLTELFRKSEGITPGKYILQTRLDKAKAFLKTKKFSVTEVAHSVGYEDVFGFIKIFKKHTNLTPGEYKEMH